MTGKNSPTGESRILVLESSAAEAVFGHASYISIPIDADHKGMVKFTKRSDQYFQQVSSNIQYLVDVAKEATEKRSANMSSS